MAPATDSPRNSADRSVQGGFGRWTGRLSLTGRILAVNIFALAFLAGGFFYLDSYRTRVIDWRMTAAARTATLLGVAIERDPRDFRENRAELLADLARTSGQRVRVYAADGTLIADSLKLGVAEEQLRDPAEEAWQRHVARFLDRMVDTVVFAAVPPNYVEPGADRASAWPELVQAMKTGQPVAMERYAPDRTPMISAAVRLTGGGGLMLMRNARDVTRTVRAERLRLGMVMALAVGASVLLSLFLARTIVAPLRRLAIAAVRVRLGRAREVQVPRLPSRRDEIGMLARAISDMTLALRKRIDATDAFAADVTHELKNPIASLRSALESLESVQAPDLRRRLLDIAADDVRRLDRLVTDIAEASRIDAQLSRTRFEPVDLGGLIEDLVLAREARGIPRGVRIAFARPRKGVATVMGEELRLMRVIENLLDNAVSFSPEGGLVRITATEADGDVLVSVEDEGPGIPESERETVFRRFHSVRPEGESFGKHSGLGLAIARSIIEGHQGYIEIADREDAQDGARFIIRIPPVARIDDAPREA